MDDVSPLPSTTEKWSKYILVQMLLLADIFKVFVINVPFVKYMLKILNIYFSFALFLFPFGLTLK